MVCSLIDQVSMRLLKLLSEKEMTQYQLSTQSEPPRSPESNITNYLPAHETRDHTCTMPRTWRGRQCNFRFPTVRQR